MRIPGIVGTLIVAALAVWSTNPAVAQGAKDQLVVGAEQFLTNMHPLIQVNNTKRAVIGYSQRPITAFDDKGINVCVLCETLPSINNGLAKIVDLPGGTKGMEVTIRLRSGLKWGDGVPVTSKDIEFTWKMGRDAKIGFSNYNPWTRASGLKVIDDRTVVLTIPQVLVGYDSWDQILPEHIEGPVYAQFPDGEQYVVQSLYNRAPTTPGLWDGPFMFSDYRVGTRIVMEKNPYWPGPGPALNRIIMSYRDNSAALLQNLLSGDIDGVPVSPGGISFSQMLDIRKRYPTRFQYLVAEGTNLERIAVNLDNPLLKDIRVRQAILRGIDRKAITDTLFDGLQSVADGPLGSTSPFYNPATAAYPYDSTEAKRLLTEAGWTPGPDGIRVNSAGERLSLEFVTTAGNQTREQIALVIQSQLKQIGIETVNNFVPLTKFNGNMLRERAFKALIMGSIDFPPSASPRIVLGSDAIPTAENNRVGNNFSGYRSQDMDAAVAKLEGALDDASRKEAWGEVQRIYRTDLPLLPLYFYARAFVVIPGVVDFNQGTLDPLNIWAEQWRRQ